MTAARLPLLALLPGGGLLGALHLLGQLLLRGNLAAGALHRLAKLAHTLLGRLPTFAPESRISFRSAATCARSFAAMSAASARAAPLSTPASRTRA